MEKNKMKTINQIMIDAMIESNIEADELIAKHGAGTILDKERILDELVNRVMAIEKEILNMKQDKDETYLTKDEIINLIDSRIPEQKIEAPKPAPESRQGVIDPNFIPPRGFTITEQIARSKRGMRNK